MSAARYDRITSDRRGDSRSKAGATLTTATTAAKQPAAPGAPPWRRRLYLPSYRTGEAARLAEVHPTTVRNWFYGAWRAKGRGCPVFAQPTAPGANLSWLQLVETAFVAAFRQQGVSLQALRRSYEYLIKVFNTEYPFAQHRLQTDGAHVLKELEQAGELAPDLIVTDQSGQTLWRDLILRRLYEFDYEDGLALTWHPRGRDVPIVVDPRIAYGAPIARTSGVPTWVFRERSQAGESLSEIADDFGADPAEVAVALEFEGISLAA